MKYSAMNITLIILILLIIFIIIILSCSYFKWKDRVKFVQVSSGKESFLVQNNKEEPEWISREVAERLSRLSSKIDELVLNMKNTQYPSKEVSNRLYNRWEKIRSNPKGLRETSLGETSAAYTVNKNQEMRICVRGKNGNKFEDENTMMFVCLHECAHVMSESFGHNKEFRENFAHITRRAIDLKLYKYEDFSKNNKDYCNTLITNSSI